MVNDPKSDVLYDTIFIIIIIVEILGMFKYQES